MFSIRYVPLAETFLTMLHITWQGGKCVKADGPATMTFYQYSAQKKEISALLEAVHSCPRSQNISMSMNFNV